MTRAVLLFDGDCGFCTSAATWWTKRLPKNDESVALPFQQVDLNEFDLTLNEVAEAVHFVNAEGVHVGGPGVAAALSALRFPWKLLGGILRVVPGSWVIKRAYPIIARHRYRLPGATPACKI